MNISQHAQKRSKQRGIPQEDICFLLDNATPIYRPGGATMYMLSKKEILSIRKQLDRIQGRAVILKDGVIVTVEHRHKRTKK